MDELLIEPLGEAFGQNMDTINTSTPRGAGADRVSIELADTIAADLGRKLPLSSLQLADEVAYIQNDFTTKGQSQEFKKLDSEEVVDDMETIVARDVEQGKCAAFKRVEIVNEKRSVNEPKYTPVSTQ